MSYRVKTVSQLTGIPRNTLVAWERRHGILEPSRSEGGYRLYTDQDVAYLKEHRAPPNPAVWLHRFLGDP